MPPLLSPHARAARCAAGRLSALVAIVVLVAAMVATLTVVAAAPTVASTVRSDAERRAADLLNGSRRAAGRPSLAGCAELDAVAGAWSAVMARTGRIRHNPRASSEIRNWRAWGENVGTGSSVGVVHAALMRSSGHRANILSTRFTQMGIGVATGGGRVWITQVFRRPQSGARCTTPALPGLPDEVERVAGRDRHATAVALSRRAHRRAGTVVIASSEKYPEALVAGPLAQRVGGPVLLTPRTRLHPTTRAEIKRLGADRAIVLGSSGAISSAVDRQLRSDGLTVERLAGTDRFDTAARIARRVGGTTAVVAKGVGQGWVDAIAASGYAAHRRLPILLVDGDRVTGPTRTALRDMGVRRVEIIGGSAAVSRGVERRLAGDGITVRRLAGVDRLATSAAVADASLAAGMSPAQVWLSTARNWVDALAAGPAVARDGGVLLLTEPDRMSSRDATARWLDRRAAAVDEVLLIGGRAAVADRVGRDVARVLGD